MDWISGTILSPSLRKEKTIWLDPHRKIIHTESGRQGKLVYALTDRQEKIFY